MLSSHLMKFRAYHIIVTYSPYLHVEHSIPTILHNSHPNPLSKHLVQHVQPCFPVGLQFIFDQLSFSRNFSLLFFSMVQISIFPSFCGFGYPSNFRPSWIARKTQRVERFLVHLWPLLGYFDYRRNLGHTYSATFSRLDLGWEADSVRKGLSQFKKVMAKGREQKNEKGEVWFWKKKFNVFNQAC